MVAGVPTRIPLVTAGGFESNGIEFYAVNKNFPEEEFNDSVSRKINADICVEKKLFSLSIVIIFLLTSFTAFVVFVNFHHA